MLLALLTSAGTLDGILARLQEKRDGTDFRASGRLVRVSGTGERKSYHFAMRARAFPGEVRLFCEITEPAPARIRMLLESKAGRASSIQLGHAGDRASRQLPAENWGQALLETDFSYEDLMESHFLWRNQTLVGEKEYGARRCQVVRSEPGAADPTHYSSVVSWLDRSILYPVRVEKTQKQTGVVKEFIYFGLRQSKGIWSASQIECKTRGRPGSTLLIINRGAEKANLDRGAFDAGLLIKP